VTIPPEPHICFQLARFSQTRPNRSRFEPYVDAYTSYTSLALLCTTNRKLLFVPRRKDPPRRSQRPQRRILIISSPWPLWCGVSWVAARCRARLEHSWKAQDSGGELHPTSMPEPDPSPVRKRRGSDQDEQRIATQALLLRFSLASHALLCERCNLCYKWKLSQVRGQGDREESARCLHAFDCNNQKPRTCIWR